MTRLSQITKSRQNPSNIESWLYNVGIKNYTINENGTVDVNGSVNLGRCDLHYIPVQFGTVNGDFNICHNRLTNLIGSPYRVNGNMICHKNSLVSLIGLPQEIFGSLMCNDNYKLTDVLKHIFHPKCTINGDVNVGEIIDNNIINKYLNQQDMLGCVEALLEVGHVRYLGGFEK